VRPLTLEGFRARKARQLEERYDAFLQVGFPTAAFVGQPEPETLQVRHAEDRTNWLGFLTSCQLQVGQGNGAVLAKVPIRCTSNRNYTVTYLNGFIRMGALLTAVGDAVVNNWRLKDLILRAENLGELNAVDLDEGWP
jgi:hypothetical protein